MLLMHIVTKWNSICIGSPEFVIICIRNTIPMINDTHNEDPQSCCFLTLSTADCVDVFIRPVYKQVIVHTLNHFIDMDKVALYAWCLMSNHLQLLVRCSSPCQLQDFENEFKAFTTDKIIEAIDAEPEMRRTWMMRHFQSHNNESAAYHIWQEHSDSSILSSSSERIMLEHFEHIHQNPVRERIVDSPVEYRYSSARDYTGMKGLVKIIKLPYIEQRLAVSENANGGFLVKYVRG